MLSTVCGPVKNDGYGTAVVAWPVISEDRMKAKFLATGISTVPPALHFTSTSLTNKFHLLNAFCVEEVTPLLIFKRV